MPIEPIEGTKTPEELATENLTLITSLKEQLGNATERINKYDGERKDFAEQKNQVDELSQQVADLKQAAEEAENTDKQYETVTQAELSTYKDGEGERFAKFNKDEAAKITANETEYQTYLGEESLATKNEGTFDEICKEHDLLIAAGTMPESTGNLKADAKIAWREAENSLYRKKLSAGQTMDFSEVNTVGKPVVPGQKELSTNTKTQKTSMPELPDDAKEFNELMGDSDNADKVNAALGIK